MSGVIQLPLPGELLASWLTRSLEKTELLSGIFFIALTWQSVGRV